MPTNQSSPWGGGKVGAGSRVNRPTTAPSVSAHAKTVPVTPVPLNVTSLEPSRRTDQAKTLSSDADSSASTLRPKSAALSVLSMWAHGDENKVNTKSQLTAVPDWSPNMPPQPNQAQRAGPKQAGGSRTETSILKKENHVGCVSDVQPGGTKQNGVLQTSQQVNGSAVSRKEAGSGEDQTGLKSPLTVCHQDLVIKGESPMQQDNKSMPEAGDCSSPPAVPPQSLTLREHLGAPSRENAPSLRCTKIERRSTTTRRIHSTKTALKCSRTANSSSKATALSNHLFVRGCSPANKPQTATADLNKQKRPCSQGDSSSTGRRNGPAAASPCPNGSMPTVLGATQEKQPTPMDEGSG